MSPSRVAIRSLARSLLVRPCGERRARVIYDALSASRELLWNSARRRLYPRYWRQAWRDGRRGVRTFAIHGEFGDAVLALPFLHREQRQHTERRVVVVVKGQCSGVSSRSARDPLSEAGVRLMTDRRGQSVNFLREFWSRVPFVDEVREGDVGDVRFRYWQAQPAFGLQGRTVGPSDYRPFIDQLFTEEDRRQAEAIWKESGRPIRVAAHLRRSAEEIAALVQELDRSQFGRLSAVALMGSRRHESVPDLNTGRVKVIDLTDNYEKGISIMPLLQTIRSADLFLGGRGGFEIFALASGAPALTVFDEDGWWEQRRLWPQRLWHENPLGCLVSAAEFDAQRVFAEHLAPWLQTRLDSRAEHAALSVAQ
jgi:hypothetical protein